MPLTEVVEGELSAGQSTLRQRKLPSSQSGRTGGMLKLPPNPSEPALELPATLLPAPPALPSSCVVDAEQPHTASNARVQARHDRRSRIRHLEVIALRAASSAASDADG
jgi:hypothetical protein